MISRDKKNFLISVFVSILIFIVAYVLGAYVMNLTSKVYGLLVFFLVLIGGIIVFLFLMMKYRKVP